MACLLYFQVKSFFSNWNSTGTAVPVLGIKFCLISESSFQDYPTSTLQDMLHPSPFIDSIYFINYKKLGIHHEIKF